MMLDTLTAWMKATALHEIIVGTTWGWPLLEILHFVGLCLLFGGLLIIDLRLIGLCRQLSLAQAGRFVPAALVGFAINLISGALFLVGDPERYWGNIAFQAKMALVLLAGLNALWFNLRLRPAIDVPPMGHRQRRLAGLSGALSLGLWTGVIVMGRLIPYLELPASS